MCMVSFPAPAAQGPRRAAEAETEKMRRFIIGISLSASCTIRKLSCVPGTAEPNAWMPFLQPADFKYFEYRERVYLPDSRNSRG